MGLLKGFLMVLRKSLNIIAPLRFMKISEQNSTIFLAIVACLLWSSAFAGLKIGLPYTTPLYFAGIRFFISGLILIPFILPKITGLTYSKKVLRKIGIVSVLQVSLQYSLFYIGMDMINGATGAIIIGSQPLFIAIAAHFFMHNDRLTVAKLGVITLGFGGIILVNLSKNNADQNQLMGVLLILAVNLAGTAVNIFISRDKQEVPPMVLSSLSMMLGGFTLFLLALSIEDIQFFPREIDFYISLFWLVAVSAIAVSIWFTLLKRPQTKVSNLNVWKFLVPVSGAILAWILLPNENPDVLSILGMVIIGIALLLLNYIRRKALS